MDVKFEVVPLIHNEKKEDVVKQKKPRKVSKRELFKSDDKCKCKKNCCKNDLKK